MKTAPDPIETLKKATEKIGSVEKLAKEIQVSRQAIYLWMKGDRKIPAAVYLTCLLVLEDNKKYT